MAGFEDGESGVAVVLLNYQGWRDTLACIDSLLTQGRLFQRLVICDNASPDDSWTRLSEGLVERSVAMAAARERQHLPARLLWAAVRRDEVESSPPAAEAWVVLIDNRENLGFAGGNNVGLQLLQADPAVHYFWLLNNDTELAPGSMKGLLATAARRAEIDLWGCTVLYHGMPDRVQALGGGHMNRRTAETRHVGAFRDRTSLRGDASEVAAVEAELDYVLGASMFVTRRWLERVGLLAEDYFLYYEELDWALRGRRLGFRLGYSPEAVVFHKEGASIGTAPSGGSTLSVFHLARSRMIFVRSHCAWSVRAFAFANMLWKTVKHLLRMRARHSLANLMGALDGCRCPLTSPPPAPAVRS